MKKRSPPGVAPDGLEGGSSEHLPKQQHCKSTSCQPENPTLIKLQEPAPDASVAPPITRGRCWEDYDRKAISCARDELAGDLNHELAREVNQAIKWVDQSDPDQLDWYLDCHAEIFSLLDTVYLLMREMDITDREARCIASATRKHVARAMARWRTHQIEIMEAALAFYDATDIEVDNVNSEPAPPSEPPPPEPEPPPKRKPASWLTWRHQGRART